MGKKLYCGNLSYNTTSSDLDQIFGEYGTVKSAKFVNGVLGTYYRQHIEPAAESEAKPKKATK